MPPHDSTLTQILISLLTITMSGVVAAYVTSTLNSRREDRRARREWLERLGRSFSAYCAVLGEHWIQYTHVMKGKISYNDALEMTIRRGSAPVKHFDELEMLVTIYWPEFDDCLKLLKRLRTCANEVLDSHKRRYLEGMLEDKQSFDAIAQCVNDLDSLEELFRARVRQMAKRIGSHAGE